MRRKFKIYTAILLFIVAGSSASILINFAAINKYQSVRAGERDTNDYYHHLLMAVKKSQAELYKFEAGFSLDLNLLVEAVEEAEGLLESIADLEKDAALQAKLENLAYTLEEYKSKVSMVVTETSKQRKEISARDASDSGSEMEKKLDEMDRAVEARINSVSLQISKKLDAAQTMVVATVVVVAVTALIILLHIRSTIAAPFKRFMTFLDEVAKSGDLSRRAELPGDRDLALLAGRFNEMMSGLETKELELQSSYEELEVSNEELQNSYVNLEDLTAELEAKTQDLSDANEELKGMDRMKNEFMQNVSHELRTPLTPIVGYLELFMTKDLGKLDPVQTEIIGDMFQCGRRLGFVIDSLLEMVSLQEEQLTEKFEPLDIKSLVSEVANMIKEDADDKGLTYSIECQDKLQSLMGARKKVILMLNHILKNAVKFTPEGGNVSFTASLGDAEDVRFVISDNGIGIREDKLKSIFEPFLQIDSSTTRDFEGIGLGLALVKKVVDMHRGIISIDSSEDEGTTVTVSIPLA